jgi:hypothetical protein
MRSFIISLRLIMLGPNVAVELAAFLRHVLHFRGTDLVRYTGYPLWSSHYVLPAFLILKNKSKRMISPCCVNVPLTDIFACIFVASGTCLQSRCLATTVSSGFNIPAFRYHVIADGGEVKWIYSCNRPWRPIGLWDVEAPTFPILSTHRWRWG